MDFGSAIGSASGFGAKLKPWQRFVVVSVAVGVEFGLGFEESGRGRGG